MTIIFGNERLGFWSVKENKKLRELEPVPSFPVAPYIKDLPGVTMPKAKPWQSANALMLSPNGKILAAAHGPGDVTLYRAETGKKIGKMIHSFRIPAPKVLRSSPRICSAPPRPTRPN
jgi:hypothetical protein